MPPLFWKRLADSSHFLQTPVNKQVTFESLNLLDHFCLFLTTMSQGLMKFASASARWQCAVSESLPRRPLHRQPSNRWMSFKDLTEDKPPTPPIQRPILTIPTNPVFYPNEIGIGILCSSRPVEADHAPRRPHRRGSLQ
jgi:hypothetical protein